MAGVRCMDPLSLMFGLLSNNVLFQVNRGLVLGQGLCISSIRALYQVNRGFVSGQELCISSIGVEGSAQQALGVLLVV